jgi:hypothetical protein
MSPLKLSLFNRGDEPDEEIELDDDDLVTQFKSTVDATPDLTLKDALREGMQHVVDKRSTGGSGTA